MATLGPNTEEEVAGPSAPYAAGEMEEWPVHKLDGNVKNDGPECVMPWKSEPDDTLPGLDLNFGQ